MKGEFLEISKFLAAKGVDLMSERLRTMMVSRGTLRITLHETTERSKSGQRRAQLVEQTRRMRGVFFFLKKIGATGANGSFLFCAKREVDLATHQWETCLPIFHRSYALSDSCLVEGVAELTAYLSD